MFKISIVCLAALIAFCPTTAVQAEIHTIMHIEEIVPAVEKDTLVLFNIAEVLLDSQVSLGTSPWRKYIKKTSQQWKQNPGVNVHDRLTLLAARRVPHKSVEDVTPELIDKWQHEGIVVMALTSRGKSEWYDTQVEGVDILTEKLLSNAGIDFSLTKLPEEFSGLVAKFGPSYGRGILYATHHEKDELLTAVLQETHYHPAKVVFVDDKRDSLEAVDVAMKKLGIPFVGYWYRRTAELHRDFNPMIAHIQLETLLSKDILLSDDEAAALLNPAQKADAYFIDLLNRHPGLWN